MKMTEQFQYASMMAETNTDPAHLNLRNDQPSIISLNDSILFCAYSRYGSAADPGNGGEATIYGIYSYDNGITWETPFILLPVISTEVNFGASIYLQDNGNIILLFNQKVSSNYWLKKAVSTNSGQTFSGVTLVYTFTKKMSSAPDRILKLESGTLLYATSQRTNDEDSPLTANNNGRLFYSSDDGDTWVNTNLDIQSADQSCQEPGMFCKNGVVGYYWRSDRTLYQKYVTLSESDNFSTYSAEQNLGFFNPSATYTIKYDEINDVFWLAKHGIYRVPDMTASNVLDRVYLELHASRRDLISWQRVALVDYAASHYFFEPSVNFIEDQILISYSKYITYSGSYKYDMLCRRIPMASVLPVLNYAEYNHLDIVYRQPFWQTSGGGDKQQPEFDSISFDKYPRWQAYWRRRNSIDAKYNSFAPSEEIRTYGSTIGVSRIVDREQWHTSFPFETWVYSANGLGTGINGNQPIQRVMLKNGLVLKDIYANGRHKVAERLQVGSKTQAEIDTFGQVEDSQIIFNSTTKKFQGRANGVWENLH